MNRWILVVNALGLVVMAVTVCIVVVRLKRMEARILAMDSAKPFWATLQTKLASDLLHPSPQFKEMDDLLHALEDLTITDEQRARLRELLVERTTSNDPEVSDSERSSARIMLDAMGKVLEEAKNPAPLTNVELVGTKAVPETDEEE